LEWNEVRPASFSLRIYSIGGNTENAPLFYEIFWWGHILVILVFMNYLPYSKHLHVITSIPNTYLANIEPKDLI
jgi:tellurite resistance protein TehA-like permease